MNNKAFTLIELLVVISIIAILAVTIIPNFIGFDSEARIAATKSNLDTLRTRVTLFRAKEGRYPVSLEELVKLYYLDAGVKKQYLQKIPDEMISKKSGNRTVEAKSLNDPLTGDGGWVYIQDTADVKVDIVEPLDKKWGDNSGQVPASW